MQVKKDLRRFLFDRIKFDVGSLVTTKTNPEFSLAVLFITYLFHPVNHFAVEVFLYSNVRHACSCGGAMPMLFVCIKPNYITRMNFFNRSAFTLYPTATCSNDQCLA